MSPFDPTDTRAIGKDLTYARRKKLKSKIKSSPDADFDPSSKRSSSNIISRENQMHEVSGDVIDSNYEPTNYENVKESRNDVYRKSNKLHHDSKTFRPNKVGC